MSRRIFVETLEDRVLLSGKGNLVFHTGHYHTVLRNAAIAAAANVSTTAATDTAVASSDASSGSTASPAASTVTYNRNAAVAYANQYWDEVVGDGYFWINGSTDSYYGAGTAVPVNVANEDGGIGDDCAHFVSSCIGSPPGGGAGGLTIPSRASPTYGEPGAARLDELLVGNSLGGYGTTYECGELVSSVSQLTPGDVIGYDWDGSGDGSMSGIDHTVLYLGNGKIACHSASEQSVAWNWANSSSTITFFIHITSPDSIVPTTPTNSSPANNATGLTTTPKLTASAFSDGALGSSQTAAEWQIYSGSTLVYDSGTDTTDLASITVPSGKLTGGTTYTWKVRYEDNYGDWSSYSTATTFSVGTVVVDVPPTLTSISVGSANIGQGGTQTITPVGLGDTTGTVTSVVYYYESNGTPGLQTGSGGDTVLYTASSSPFVASINTIGEAPGTTYTIYAQATNDQGQTSPVQTSSYTVTPTVSSITAQAISGSAINITWPAPPAGVSHLDLERSLNGGSFVQIATLSGTATSYPDTGLQSDSEYTYRIRATTSSANGSYITAASIYTFLPGDANGDGTVDINDLNIVLNSMRTGAAGTWADGDFNGDGVVDISDFNLLLSYYGQSLPIMPVA